MDERGGGGIVFNRGVMAGLYFMGAAGRAEETEEIDFVPHILPCSSWFALGWHGRVPQHTGPVAPCVIVALRAGGGPHRSGVGAWKHGRKHGSAWSRWGPERLGSLARWYHHGQQSPGASPTGRNVLI